MMLGDMPIEENLDERKPLPSLPSADVIEWLKERAANCHRLAVLCKPKDVDGWLDDMHRERRDGMLFKIDYAEKSADETVLATKWVNFASDKTEAVKRFMNWFFAEHRSSKVRIDLITEVEFVGDLTAIDAIDETIRGH